MTTQLRITTVFESGRIETQEHAWPGWQLEVAASVMRARRHVSGGGLVYDLPLTERHLETGIIRQTHEWIDAAELVMAAGS